MKPNSDEARRNSRELAKRKFHARLTQRRKSTAFDSAAMNVTLLGQPDIPIIVEQLREKRAHVARPIEMSGDAGRATAD
ncbi:hypothetical protein BraRD5C2_58240 [Bradyrhizobium sp. RD5-C2]|nr:hypothetical protein BraRD5C2_58240 [Bradyrhizobium sp. RD5-C2]